MPTDYEWYDLIDDKSLEQGDILFNYPIIEEKDPSQLLADSENADAKIDKYDVIIMTHSCDISNRKIDHLILCPHWDIDIACGMDSSLKSKLEPIRKGQLNRYLMLNKSDKEIPMGIRIVDFGRIFSSSKRTVEEFAYKHDKRLRLAPPYREHLAQGFARYFMRVGLPQAIEL